MLLVTGLAAGCSAAPDRPAVSTAIARFGAETPRAGSPCPMELPDEVGARASVLGVSRPHYSNALAPVLLALCDCTKGGEKLQVEAKILPERGEVRATALNDPATAKCVEQKLSPGQFDSFELERTDCIDCTPRPMPAPAHPDKIAEFAKTQQKPDPPVVEKARPDPERQWLTFEFAYERPVPEGT